MFAGDTRGEGDFVISTISGFIVPSLKLRLRQEVVLHLEKLVGYTTTRGLTAITRWSPVSHWHPQVPNCSQPD